MIEIVQGDGAIHNVSGQSFVEPVVRLTQGGKPVEGGVVTFFLPQTGAGGTFPEGRLHTAVAGSDGQVTGRGLRPNLITGPWEIRIAASFQGRVARAVISQINAAPLSTARKSRSRTYLVLGIVAAGAVAGAASALGGSHNAAPAAAGHVAVPTPPMSPVPVVVSPGGGNIGPP
jgi:hypothetical protein